MDTPTLIRRSLFLVALSILTLGNLFSLFSGLSSPHAMDQAQIGREIARGNGFSTQFIRPISYAQTEKKAQHIVSLKLFPDTYHSPLNPLVNAAILKLIQADKADSWKMEPNQMIFPLDRVIASISTVFFLLSIGMSFLLISRVFDTKIAGVCAVIMLFNEAFWKYALSGLPQMLMLMLFTSGIYFVFRAIEETQNEKKALTQTILAAVCFTLLALTHWMTVWIAIGYILFASFSFKPKGFAGLSILALLIIPASYCILRNYHITGQPFGTAYYTLYNGLGSGSETSILRNLDLSGASLVDNIFSNIIRNTLTQSSNIITFFAGIFIAPLFFITLLHPFKHTAISSFRWALLCMWITTALGLAIFGISTNPLDPNQLHLLFAPIMTAYGIAFISILWSRIPVVTLTPSLKNAHLFALTFICAAPLAISLQQQIRQGIQISAIGGIPHWPPYYAPALHNDSNGLKAWTKPNQIVMSDQPWAVAWYADRTSIWLPPTQKAFLQLESIAAQQKTPINGILISPTSHNTGNLSNVYQMYQDFTALVIDGPVVLATFPPGIGIFEKSPKIEAVSKRYPHRVPLVGMEMIFYSDRPIERTSNL